MNKKYDYLYYMFRSMILRFSAWRQGRSRTLRQSARRYSRLLVLAINCKDLPIRTEIFETHHHLARYGDYGFNITHP